MADNVIIHRNDFPALIRNSPKLIDKAIDALAQDGHRFIQQGMEQSPPTGNIYMKPSGISHTASSPGNMPRIDDSILVNSLYVRPDGLAKRIIGVGAEHGFHLEFGTSEMEARPFMGPMIGHIQQVVNDGFFNDLLED